MSGLVVDTTTNTAADGGILSIMLVIIGAVYLFFLVARWKLYSKAGRPGWASLIPIYSTVVFCQICGRSGWLTLALMIPGVNVIVSIMLTVDLARVFGRGTGFMLGLIFLSPIFFPILAFGSSRYVGRPSGRSGMTAPALA
jgi:Family of unknown function (DUF5684)